MDECGIMLMTAENTAGGPSGKRTTMDERKEIIQQILDDLTPTEKVALYGLLLSLQQNQAPAENQQQKDPS